MASPISGADTSSKSECFINLNEMVVNWAWRQFDRTITSRKQQKLRQKEKKSPNKYIAVNIDWSQVRFTDETKWIKLSDDPDVNGQSQSASVPSISSPAAAAGIVGKQEPRASVLFQTRFANNTNETQEYTMRTEKTTRSSMTTAIEKGFTRGFDMSLKLASPCQVFEANAGYRHEVSLTNVDGETFEEELTWGVESLIHVNPLHVADASLVVQEQRQTGSFVVETRIRGLVYVTFTALRQNNCLIKSTANDIAAIVGEFLEQEKRKAGGRVAIDWMEVVPNSQVVIKTSGCCKFRYGIKQEIRLNQTPL